MSKAGKREIWGWYRAENEGERLVRRKAKKKRRREAKRKQYAPTIAGKDPIKEFYKSVEWKRLRYDALKAGKGRCECCGAGPNDGAVLNVDHIKPVSRYWHLRLVLANLQVLCGSCNAGKGARDSTDWRKPAERQVIWADGVTWDQLEQA